MLPASAAEQYRVQQQISTTTATAVSRLWRRMGDDFDTSWRSLGPQIIDVVATGRRAAVMQALPYAGNLLQELGEDADPLEELNPAGFLAAAPDGRRMDSLLQQSVIRTKSAVASGLETQLALAVGGRWLTKATFTTLADTRRDVYAADIIQRPAITGYVRMLNTPSCNRCVVLAGKWFRWNAGFQRHPNCDCQHIPASENRSGDLRTDPYAYFHSLSPEEQERTFGRSEARALREGADIYQVVNQSVRKLPTSNSLVDQIYRNAGTRTNAIRMLRDQGFILPRGQVVVARAPGVLTDAEVLARGRGRGTYRVGDQTRTTARAARYDAAATGQRDPLNRATMTAAERRLYDASYRLQYARRNGVVPRSIGLNSADAYSGARGVPVTPAMLADLEAALAREVSRIEAGTGAHRVFVELGLDDAAKTAAVFDRIQRGQSGARVLPPATQAGGRGGAGVPPTRAGSGFGRFDDEPDESDKEAFEAYWRRRQDALGAGDPGETLKRHEIIFYEQFKVAGETFELLPRDRAGWASVNDFIWTSRGGVPTELKSFEKPRQSNVAAEISRVVLAAQRHGVVKDTFIVYSRRRSPTAQFLAQMRSYNVQHLNERGDARIRHLFWWDGAELHEIEMT